MQMMKTTAISSEGKYFGQKDKGELTSAKKKEEIKLIFISPVLSIFLVDSILSELKNTIILVGRKRKKFKVF